jgi:hypothetical protein
MYRQGTPEDEVFFSTVLRLLTKIEKPYSTQYFLEYTLFLVVAVVIRTFPGDTFLFLNSIPQYVIYAVIELTPFSSFVSIVLFYHGHSKMTIN